MLRNFKSTLMLSGLLVVIVAVPTAAQDKKKLAYTDVNTVDDDFIFQGEYLGNISAHYRPVAELQIGLQVVARGDGQFIAVEYPGGLPGSGWNGGTRLKLAGQRNGNTLWLEGSGHRFAIVNGCGWAYHAGNKPVGQLRKVYRSSQTLGATPPWNATVLFDGTNTDHFKNGKMTDDGLLIEGTEITDLHRNFTLHLEFRLPYMPYATGQGRANSGVYLLSRYEVQILDSFGLDGVENECAALYRYRKPDLNMCFPPLRWQTYDIDFTSAKFDDQGNKTQNARISVWHNGIAVHNNFEVERKTGAGSPEGRKLLPTKLQNHGNPIRFRNIWVVNHDPTAWQPSPVMPRGTRSHVVSPPVRFFPMRNHAYWIW